MAGPAYTIEIKPAAQRDLKRIKNRSDVRRIARAIDALANNPRPAGATVLQGEGSILRLRVGDYRILYEVDDVSRQVLILRIAHRRDIYHGR